MKKIRLNIDDIKVESFETTSQHFGRGTAFGQAYCDVSNGVGEDVCQGGGGNGSNTWCFGEACQTQDYMYTCQIDSCPNTNCGGGGFENTQYFSCTCTDPVNDPACNTLFPSNLCMG